MRLFKDLPAGILGGLLIVCAVTWYFTRDASSGRVVTKKPAASSQAAPIDQRLLETARQMAPIAATTDEQDQAREALRLADHELDQAFAAALREAAARTAPTSGPGKQLADRIAASKARLAADQRQIAKWTKAAADNDTAAGQLELAKAQLALDEDELEDAQQDLARQGGDEHATLERALQEHEAALHQTALPPKAAATIRTATLNEQIQSWLSLGDKERQLEGARQQASNHAATLDREHDALEQLISNKPVSNAGPAQAGASTEQPSSDDTTDEEDTAAMVARLRHLSDQRKTLTDLDKRIQDSQQLADVYKRWIALAETSRRNVLHLMLGSIAAVLAILLAVVLTGRAIRGAFDRHADHKRLHQLRVMVTIAVQVVGAMLILLIIFGTPNQTSTIIG